MIRPDVRALLDRIPPESGPPEAAAIRESMRMLAAVVDLPEPALATARMLETAPLPTLLLDRREHRDPGPVLVWFHGGGFVFGGIDTHRSMAADMAQRLDLPVLLVDYRLAPEAPYPAAVDDAEEIARWVAGGPAELGREVTGLVLGGDSAGGTMTIVTAMALRDRPAYVPVVAQLLMWPATDLIGKYPSQREFAEGYLLTEASRVFYQDAYRPVVTDVRASPMQGDLAGLPPAVVLTAGLDPLRDEGRAYAAGLITAGVPTTFLEAVGNIHAFGLLRKAIPSSVPDLAQALSALRALI
ncbi:MAG TPA: alpha/beta hydrolase [Kutzneria sp.]|nr:alpha/beta hydrolase [Kutzneria sp.]